MTNLSPELPAWRRRFTRERVLVGAPVLVAVLVVALLTGCDAEGSAADFLRVRHAVRVPCTCDESHDD